jgi:hypothetical protein
VPAGWSNLYDVAGQFDLSFDAGGQHTYPDGITFSDRISVFAEPVAASAVHDLAATGVGTSAADLSSWLAGREDLVATAPERVSIAGATAYRVSISLPTGVGSSPDDCAAVHLEPRCKTLFVGTVPASKYSFALFGPESAAVYLIDWSGRTVMVVVDDVDGVDAPDLFSAATPIVESIGFAP